MSDSRTRPPESSEIHTTDGLYPRRRTLSGFADEALARPGIGLRAVEAWSEITVETRNTVYELTLLDPWSCRVLAKGGRFFATPAEAVLCGSSFGGSLIKLRWIAPGMRMELVSGELKIVTSPVRGFRVAPPTPLPGPF